MGSICCLFLGVVVSVETLQLCSTTNTLICYPCVRNLYSSDRCAEITYDMKIINFNTDGVISYNSYINSGVYIIEQPSKITFYSCRDRYNYFQVTSETYYPIGNGSKLNYSTIPLGVPISTGTTTRFTYCLLMYCLSLNNNQLKCNDKHLDSLEFQFDTSNISLDCIQNITYAQIYSENITLISRNYFFRNAYNIIYLKLDFENLKSIQLNSFQNLYNLRVLKISYIDIKLDYDTIFQYNPRLIQISAQNQLLWVKCNRKSADNHSIVPYLTMFISYFLILILLTYIGIAVYRTQRRIHIVSTESIEMSAW